MLCTLSSRSDEDKRKKCREEWRKAGRDGRVLERLNVVYCAVSQEWRRRRLRPESNLLQIAMAQFRGVSGCRQETDVTCRA